MNSDPEDVVAAIDDLDNAIKLKPEYAKAYFHMDKESC